MRKRVYVMCVYVCMCVRVLMSWPSGIDQSIMVLSSEPSEPDARTLPSGLNDTVKTEPVWPCMWGAKEYKGG